MTMPPSAALHGNMVTMCLSSQVGSVGETTSASHLRHPTEPSKLDIAATDRRRAAYLSAPEKTDTPMRWTQNICDVMSVDSPRDSADSADMVETIIIIAGFAVAALAAVGWITTASSNKAAMVSDPTV